MATGIGAFMHLVELARPGVTPDDPEGGFERTWIALNPATWYCSITAATARDLERIAGGAYSATATHLIRGRYHPQLAPDCRITFQSRVFDVASAQVDDQAQATMTLVAIELIGVAPPAPAPPAPPLAHAATHAAGGSDPIVGLVTGPDAAVAGSIAVGTNPAQSGAIRLANGQRITGRNAANTADQHLIRVNSDDTVNVGDQAHLLILESPTVIAQNDIMSGGNMLPNADNVRDVGRADIKWRSGLFGTSVAVGTNPAQSGAIRLANNQAITARDVGNTADFDVIRLQPNNWVNVGNGTPLTIGGVIVATGGLILDGYSVITITEHAAPSAPGSNSVNLWLQDNGAGKSQLMIQFATGAPIAIATEP
jgi:head-tail adaptor